MALVKEPEEDLPEELHHRQLERSTLMQNAVALYFSDQVLRKELKSYSNLKSYGYRRLEDQQQKKRVLQTMVITRLVLKIRKRCVQAR